MFDVHARTHEQDTNRTASLQPNKPELALRKAAIMIPTSSWYCRNRQMESFKAGGTWSHQANIAHMASAGSSEARRNWMQEKEGEEEYTGVELESSLPNCFPTFTLMTVHVVRTDVLHQTVMTLMTLRYNFFCAVMHNCFFHNLSCQALTQTRPQEMCFSCRICVWAP